VTSNATLVPPGSHTRHTLAALTDSLQAAAQDARFRAASGEVSAAWARAKPGTVAAWVYGNNLVDRQVWYD
jgi:hypothetical protein